MTYCISSATYRHLMLAMGMSIACASAALADAAHFSLKNNTDVVITRLDVETYNGNDWWTVEEGELLPGQKVNLTIDDGRPDCVYHFRVYYQDDGLKFRDYNNVNVCNNPAFSVP